MRKEKVLEIVEIVRKARAAGEKPNLSRANFSGVDLSRANFSGVDLSRADLAGVDLSRADLTGADLRGADLTRANLTGADLSQANLARANLKGANLPWAKLTGASLKGANFVGADLFEADLSRADLSGVNLRGTDLKGANFSEAGLTGANLSGANLREANFTGACLSITCLDPDKHLPLLEDSEILAAGLEIDGSRVKGWRTLVSKVVGSHTYTPGWHVAPVLSMDTDIPCHPGIYLSSLEWLKKEYGDDVEVVRCWCYRDELVHAGNKWRAQRVFIEEGLGSGRS